MREFLLQFKGKDNGILIEAHDMGEAIEEANNENKKGMFVIGTILPVHRLHDGSIDLTQESYPDTGWAVQEPTISIDFTADELLRLINTLRRDETELVNYVKERVEQDKKPSPRIDVMIEQNRIIADKLKAIGRKNHFSRGMY